jgi:hypothetical protein
MVRKLLCLALAGAVGTIARYGLDGLVHRINGVSFSMGDRSGQSYRMLSRWTVLVII